MSRKKAYKYQIPQPKSKTATMYVVNGSAAFRKWLEEIGVSGFKDVKRVDPLKIERDDIIIGNLSLYDVYSICKLGGEYWTLAGGKEYDISKVRKKDLETGNPILMRFRVTYG